MTQLDRIYQELGEHICLYPFFGAFYQTNNVIPIKQENSLNSVRPCSIVMSDDMQKWDIDNQSIHQSRNNSAWKKMREDFSQNKFHKIADCRSCSNNERSGATSPRQQNNSFLANFLNLDIVSEVKNILDNDNTVNDIYTMDYYPSNYCNYSCIMCAGGASSQRQTFEVKILKRQERIVLNSADPDFYQALSRVQVINFTGGETALQKQVFEVMDYLIENDMAKNILITLLTNASSSPDDLDERFKHFKQVIYNVSIDGVGSVIEYQRRGASWPKVETNSLRLLHHEYISTVINFVLTAVNVFDIINFVDWCYENNIGPTTADTIDRSYINVSPVFRVDHLGVAVLPDQLRELALNRLKQGRKRFESSTEIFDIYYTQLVDQFIGVIETTTHHPAYLPEFIKHIQLEDSVSKTKLIEVVPEWAPYFQS
jgi:MoaA/NifB/PqqE/SkfB family radical SAM enzyme